MDFEKEFFIAKSLARRAGSEIMKIYESEFKITEKEDENAHRSPLTEADLLANEIIVTGLRRNFPEYSILTEEEKDNKERLNNKYVWIIDPIDGTKEFISRNGEFTVNIALVHQNRPILGVIYAPALDQAFYAAKDQGACISNGNERPIKVSSRSMLNRMILVKSRSHASGKLLELIEKNIFARTRTSGSSLKGCLVAKGDSDVYYRLGPVNEWDICAMHAIINAAGGKMTDLDGKEIKYNKEDVKINGFLVSNNTIHKELIEMGK